MLIFTFFLSFRDKYLFGMKMKINSRRLIIATPTAELHVKNVNKIMLVFRFRLHKYLMPPCQNIATVRRTNFLGVET